MGRKCDYRHCASILLARNFTHLRKRDIQRSTFCFKPSRDLPPKNNERRNPNVASMQLRNSRKSTKSPRRFGASKNKRPDAALHRDINSTFYSALLRLYASLVSLNPTQFSEHALPSGCIWARIIHRSRWSIALISMTNGQRAPSIDFGLRLIAFANL